MPELPPQIQFGLILVGLGLTTYEQLRDYFKGDGADDETLAALDAEYERRLQRRA